MADKNSTVVTVTPSVLTNILDNTLFSIKSLTPFIWGGPGIGKSSIVKSLAEKNKYNFVDIRLSMMDPVSLMGVMVPNIAEGTSKWLPPSIFNNDVPTLYFFDELNSAPPSIQAAAYQIILDRKIGQHSLKQTDLVVAAGNNVNDRGVTFKMPAPLANRFIHLNLCASFDDFNEYAIKNRLHKHVVGYLNYQKGDLYNMPSCSEVKGFPTPRSWEFVSKILYKADETQISSSNLLPMIAGAVGEGVAYKFISYRKVAESIVNVNEIIEGKIKVKEMKSSNIDETYALVMALCYSLAEYYDAYKRNKLQKDLYDKYCDNFIGFLMTNEIQPEMVIMAARYVLAVFDIEINVDLPNWDKFFNKYSRSIREAFTI
ncbi:MAG: MoxR family ATPase [Candidatus Woesearchaeota archaeon]